jgi:hypothetical protein
MNETIVAQLDKFGWYPLEGHRVATDELMIERLELNLGFKLPSPYREFLMAYGMSSRGKRAVYPDRHRPGQPGGRLGVIYGLNPSSTYDLWRRKSGLGDRLPPHILPIADSPGGMICLSLAGDDCGKVYWWDRAEDSDDPRENLTLIADDFESFIGSLHIDES